MLEKTWRQMKDEIDQNTVVIIPVGSIEQHGLHAPLGTDLIIAKALAEKVESYQNTIIGPAVPVGVAEYHRHFTGTLWVKPEILKDYVGEIVKSFSYHGWRKVIIVNGHGGNREPLKELARYLKMEEKINMVVWTWFESIENEIIKIFGHRPPLHADQAETAMLMAIAPELIVEEQLEESFKQGSKVWGQYYAGTMVSQEVRDFSKSGATGDPTATDIENGKKMLIKSTENLKELIDYLISL